MRLLKILAIISLLTFAAIIGLWWLGVEIVDYPPKKPENVPVDANWAGGVDGGNWVRCVPMPDSELQYDCDVYNENGNCILAQGGFRLFKSKWDSEHQKALYFEVDSPIEKLEFNYYDQGNIKLKNDFVLRRLP